MDILSGPDFNQWVDIYKRIISWEIKLDESQNPEMKEILIMQKSDANKEFSKYIIKHYESWMKSKMGLCNHRIS